ncbi:hypothetical protein ABE61_17760 [Lysinibacillus sphaericus]|uniref:histidine phosphatase family protein n=1 Tax=Lysinibacillus sphaericus TaxID=1421 RepID=UPI0018CC939D|nr:histidine phosphatase family protein [Lysinibacillus sphaericus]MBG9455850.1 hypothetical protein [Lysinibacillus sphaericus]MBG9479690.1 hypothetical protein [Lysinibacillus sphaericus]MBG9594423.1 hypothetical protein [Lysinibacillus sphaericus]
MEKNSTIFVIRHGEAISNEPYSPLTDIGQKQAEQLAEFLSPLTNFENDTIISSPFLRASQTAAILAARTNQTFCTDQRLKERNIGDYQGENNKLWDELREHFKDMDHKFVHGESNREVCVRVTSLIEELRQSNHQNIFLITHRLTMLVLFNHYDTNFDFDKGASITNPDVYSINFINGEVEIKRLWKDKL